MKQEFSMKGHIYAFITILIWGTTFISTKIMLVDFKPIEILFYRFGIGWLALFIAFPHRLKGTTKKQELLFAGAGLCGVTLYFLFENIALTHTTASNVGVIVSIGPFFIAILAHLLLGDEKPKTNFYIGFLAAMIGIFLISFNGASALKISPVGDLLAILATLVWSIYSILTRKISQFGYSTIQATRKIFSYGLLFMIPALFIFNFEFGIERFMQPVNIFNILFLGLGASALCFVTWNLAVKLLGVVKTSVYIYAVPVITVVTSVIILGEKLTWMSALGTFLTLMGLFISERKMNFVTKEQRA